ncbi:MAG: hypothetical protein JWQ06_2232, partial [Mucilaginibacter sp.]|nr:hypothetical protein [Mucilaginibacter sp.]
MLLNYIKIAWRNLINQKLYSFINISGLAVGLAVGMMIMLYVAHEMSYDSFHKNGRRIFSAHYISKQGDSFFTFDWIKYNSGLSIKQTQPSVEAYMGTLDYSMPLVVNLPRTPQNKFSENKLVFADAGFFKFFSFKLLSGQIDNVLKNPFSVVISREMAKKYFGNVNPVGKAIILKTDSAYTYQVTGVAENAPSNSSIDFNFVAAGSSLMSMKNYNSFGPSHTFLLLKHEADSAILRRGIQLAINKTDKNTNFALVPLANLHLKGVFGNSSQESYLKIFPIVAILILLLALVNYMSLATARATLRAKEIGVRKVSGASRKTIALQFYIESAFFTLLSFGLAYILFYAFKPWFLNVLQLKIDDSFLYSPLVLVLLFTLLIVTILLTGSYPSLVLSAFKPTTTLKGKMSKNAGGILIRKVFTTLQFTIAVALIICGITIDRQLYFFRHTDTGINRDNILMIPSGNTFGKTYQPFYHDIKGLAGVSQLATSRRSIFKCNSFLMVNDKTIKKDAFIPFFDVDHSFIPLLNLKWKNKPQPNTEIASKNKILVNEAFIEKMHLNFKPVGTFIESGPEKYEVAGVLKNFNFSSLTGTIQPLAIIVKPDTSTTWNENGFNLYVKIKAHSNLPSLINTIKNIYKKYDRDTPFSYSFMDDDFNQQYKAEDRLESIFSVFTCITIILATLGLFGLAAFTIEQRTKEIGIRKVLGASLTAITTLLSK